MKNRAIVLRQPAEARRQPGLQPVLYRARTVRSHEFCPHAGSQFVFSGVLNGELKVAPVDLFEGSGAPYGSSDLPVHILRNCGANSFFIAEALVDSSSSSSGSARHGPEGQTFVSPRVPKPLSGIEDAFFQPLIGGAGHLKKSSFFVLQCYTNSVLLMPR